MKRLTTFLMALLLTWIGANAQSEDGYILNPSFEDETVTNLTIDTNRCDETVGGAWAVTGLTDWTLTTSNVDVCDLMSAAATATDNNLGTPGTAADGTYMLYLKKTWSGDTPVEASLLQTVILPAGTYRLTVDSKFFSSGATAKLVAGDASTAIVINGTSAGDANTGFYPLTELTEWTTNTLTFTVEENNTEVTLGVEMTFPNAGLGSILLDNFQLYEVMELTAHEDKFEASSGAGTANAVPTADCEAEFGHWSTTGDGLALNTWSTEGDASGMETPFAQAWVWSGGGNLSAATISHETIVGLPEGTYDVSMDIRIFSEAGNEIGSGTTFNANDSSEDLVSGSDGTSDVYGTETEEYGTYTVECEVGEDGKLDISIVIPDGATYNWIAWKNLSVVMVTSPEEYPTVSALEGNMSEEAKTAMDNAITAYNANKSSDTFHAAIDALQEAYASIQEMLILHECEAEFDHWSIDPSTSTTFQLNTWSTEADPSEMTTPFIEYWKGSGNPLTDATISHETINGEAGAIYSVSIDYRVFNENSTKVVSQGSTFNANETSADLCLGTRAVYNSVSEEEYAIGFTMLCQADATTGAIDINFNIQDADFDWFAFKNLVVKKFDPETDEWPELTVATGDMHDGYASAQTSALEAYAASPSFTTYLAAFNAVNAAHLSALFYEDVAATLEELNLDEAGQAAFSASTNGAAYENKTLEYCDMTATFVEAVKAQTTIGKDLTYVLDNTSWTDQTGTYGTGVERYSAGTAEAPFTGYTGSTTEPNKILYQSIDGLVPGSTYTVSFYAAANSTNTDRAEVNAAAGDGIAQAFANDQADAITVIDQNGCTLVSTDNLHTFVVTVGDDGVLEFGLQNVATGGNWYVAQAVSLTYYGVLENDNDYAEGDEVTVDGTVYKVVGDNLFVNGGFNNSVCGWTAGGYTTAADPDNFDIQSEGGYNGGAYLVASSGGTSNEKTPSQAIAVEEGKTYLFIGYTSGKTPDSNNLRYSALFEMSDATTEADHTESDEKSYANTIIQLEWGVDPGETSSTWTQTIGVFEATTEYVGMRMGWSGGSYDGFQLYEVEAVPVTIEWEMTDAGWGTLILPFDADEVPSGLTLYAGDALELSSDGSTLTVGDPSETIAANTPYLVSGAEGTYTFTGVATNTQDSYQVGMLVGTLVDLSQEEGTLSTDGTQYVLQYHVDETTGEEVDDGLAFYPITTTSTGVTLDAYHCYLTGVTTTALHLPGMSTGIVAVEGAETLANDAIYDLSGRRVSKAVKGVYIQNGKKVLVK